MPPRGGFVAIPGHLDVFSSLAADLTLAETDEPVIGNSLNQLNLQYKLPAHPESYCMFSYRFYSFLYHSSRVQLYFPSRIQILLQIRYWDPKQYNPISV